MSYFTVYILSFQNQCSCTLNCTSQVSSTQLLHVANDIVFRLESRLVQKSKQIPSYGLLWAQQELGSRKRRGLLGLGSSRRLLWGGAIEADNLKAEKDKGKGVLQAERLVCREPLWREPGPSKGQEPPGADQSSRPEKLNWSLSWAPKCWWPPAPLEAGHS